MKYLPPGLLCCCLLVACEMEPTDDVTPPSASMQPTLGIDITNFDPDVRPQDDFYRYVNGTWLEETQIPADKSNYGSFTELADKAEQDMRAIIEEAANAEYKEPGSDRQKVGDMYLSFMDTTRIEDLGLAPVQEELDRIEAISSYDDVIDYIGYNQRIRMTDPFGVYVNQDAKNATEYILYATQSGLGLPDRNYYFDDNFKNARQKYVKYLNTLYHLAGMPGSAEAAATVLDIETRIAEHHWTRVQNRDRNATYNKMTLADANAMTPNLDWNQMLDAAGIAGVEAVVVRQPSFFEALDDILVVVPVEDWKTYFRAKLLSNAAPYLPQAYVDANFDMYGRTLSGIEQDRPRWKKAVSTTNGVVGEIVGKLYVEAHFKEEAKTRMDEMVDNLSKAFGEAIDELEWMGPETKEEAHAKLAKFTPKIGYPEEWKDYSELEIDRNDLLGNMKRSTEVEYERNIGKLGQPINRKEWFMTPQTVNAYYSSTMNEIVFPAAILQPPFFNVEADDAVNYGAIGAVIGHEFSHGFDDQGRKSDGDGNLRDWWTEQDNEEFQKRAAMLGKQYSGYTPIDSMFINGDLTMGENIGDLAGLTMAYKAYKLSLDGEEAPVINGFTGDQRFFMGWAQVWRRKYRDDELRRRLVTDPHSPSEYRTNGIVVNIPAFYEAFDVQEGDGMYRAPDERVEIW